MEPNLDDPGFVSPLDPVPSPRAPVPPSGSSSSSEGAVDVRRKCLRCHRRMSRKSLDNHTFCSVCLDFDCDLDTCCEECTDWPESDMVAYVKHRKMLKSKHAKPRTGSDVPLSPSQPSVRSSQPVPDFDIEARIASLSTELSASLARQVEGLGSSLQQSFLALSSELSTQLAARISALSSTSCTLTPGSTPVRPGQALSPHLPVSTAGLLQESQALDEVDRNPKVFFVPSSVLRKDSGRLGTAGISQPPLVHGPDDGDDIDDDDDDRESTASVISDCSTVRLANFVYDSYPVAPRCDFEALYALSDPRESSHPRFAMYPRVSDILGEVDELAAALARRSKPLSAILPKKVRRYAVTDSQHISVAQPINPDFARLCGNKVVSNKRWGSVTFAEMQRLESVSQSSPEVCSFSLWMMSGLLSQLKHDGFNPSDPTLFNTAISSVSAALSSQARSAAAVSTFMPSKRRESLLAHATVPVSQVQKRELTVDPGSSDGLFAQDLLEKVASQVKEDAFVSSSMSMAKLSQSGSSGKSGRKAASGSARSASGSGSSGYQSSPSFGESSGKLSASPAWGGGGKRFHGDKSRAPSSKPSGFRR